MADPARLPDGHAARAHQELAVGTAVHLDEMESFTLLADQLVDDGERPAPDREAGERKDGVVLDDLGRLLHGDAFAGAHASLLRDCSRNVCRCLPGRRNSSGKAGRFQMSERCQTDVFRRQIPSSLASAISSSLKSGWAIEIRASARCQLVMPLRLIIPYSVTR